MNPRQAVPVPLRSDGTPLAGVPEQRGESEGGVEYRPPRYPVVPQVPCTCHSVQLRAWNGGHGRTEHQDGCEAT